MLPKIETRVVERFRTDWSCCSMASSVCGDTRYVGIVMRYLKPIAFFFLTFISNYSGVFLGHSLFC